MDISKPARLFQQNRFGFISWGITGLLVAGLLGFALWWTQFGANSPATRPEPTAAPEEGQPSVQLPSAMNPVNSGPGIGRALQLKTDASASTTLKPISYKVVRGDSLFGIAQQYNLKPESILYSNQATLNDNPTLLSPGMVLNIPPEDGLLYTWERDDTIESVADKFKSDLN